MKDKINAFLNSRFFIISISGISLLSWYFYQETVGTIVLTLLAIIILIVNRRIINLLPIVFNFLFLCRSYIGLAKVPILPSICLGLLILALIFFLIKQKPNFKSSKMLIGFIALAFCSVISLVNLNDNGQPLRYLYSLGNVLFLFLYLLFSSTIKKEDNNFKYICHVMMWISFVLSAQILITGFESGSFDKKITNLGWGGANSAAIYINIGIICGFYLLTKTKAYLGSIYYLLSILFFISIILLTQCRAGYLALGITIIPCLVLTYIYSPNRRKTALIYSCCLFAAMILCLIFMDDLINILKLTFKIGISDNGRFNIWKKAISDGFKHFFIGNGMFSFGSNVATPDPGRLVVMHNTFVQCFYSFGFLGLISLAYHYFEKYIVVLKSHGNIKWFFLLITLSGFVHGMLDNTYFMVSYMVVIIPFMCIMEKEPKKEKYIKEDEA